MKATILRGLAVLVSLSLFVAVVRYAGLGPMGQALWQVAGWLPLLMLLELTIIAFNALALRSLYRAAGADAPNRPFWRAVYLGNTFAVVLPAGRLMTETWKAVRLARYVTGPVSAAGAVGCQAAVLIGNAVIAALSLLGVALRCGMTWPTLAVALFSIGMIGMGGSVFLLGRARLGRWLGTRMAMVQGHGSAFDEAFLKSSRALGPATFFESCARLCQLAQVALLLYAGGHAMGAIGTLATYGLLLVGSALGDMLPAQLGATDVMLTMAGRHVGLAAAQALAMTTCLHGAQIGGALLGAAVAFVIPEPDAASTADASSAPAPEPAPKRGP